MRFIAEYLEDLAVLPHDIPSLPLQAPPPTAAIAVFGILLLCTKSCAVMSVLFACGFIRKESKACGGKRATKTASFHLAVKRSMACFVNKSLDLIVSKRCCTYQKKIS